MINEKMQQALNGQLNNELFSSYLYLSMSAYFDSLTLPGFKNWMRIQTQEELAHSAKFYDYILERDGKVTLTAIEQPQMEWKNPLHAFEAAYEHEQKITGCINDLVKLSLNENDPAANVFLQWFVTEQVEEESNAKQIVDQLKHIGDNGAVVFMLDRELAGRVYTPPVA